MSTKTAKQLATEVLAHQLGLSQRQPAKLTAAQQTIADLMMGRSRPDAGTPEADLQAMRERGHDTPRSSPRVIDREELLAQLTDDKSPASVLMRDLVRQEIARAKAEEE